MQKERLRSYESKLQQIRSVQFKSLLDEALLKMGPSEVKKQYRHLWTPENPSFGFCYVVCECLFYMLDKKPIPMSIPTEEGRHWFLLPTDNIPLDLAKDADYNYSEGRKTRFMTQHPSKRAEILRNLIQP